MAAAFLEEVAEGKKEEERPEGQEPERGRLKGGGAAGRKQKARKENA